MRRALSVAVFFILSLGAATACADDEEEARAAMRRGVAAFGRGDADAALAEYDLAKRLAPRANAPYRYAAEALISLGRWGEAVTNLDEYLEKNPNVSDAAEVRERIAKIRAEHYPAHLHIVANAEDANVNVDGEPRGRLADLDLSPGSHRIDVTAPGRRTATQNVSLEGDRATTVVFTLTPDAPETAPLAPAEAPTRKAIARPWQTVGWIGVGLGAAVLATTAIIDAAVLGPKISDYNAASDRGDASARDLRDQAKALQTGTIVGYASGVVIAGAGAALLLFAPAPAASRVTLNPWLSPGHLGWSAHWRF